MREVVMQMVDMEVRVQLAAFLAAQIPSQLGLVTEKASAIGTKILPGLIAKTAAMGDLVGDYPSIREEHREAVWDTFKVAMAVDLFTNKQSVGDTVPMVCAIDGSDPATVFAQAFLWVMDFSTRNL